MKTLSNIFLIAIIGLLAFISCDDKILEIDGIAPNVNAKFINKDSLSKLNTATSKINKEITAINDSISLLDSLVEAGDETDYGANFISLDDMKADLNTQKNKLNKIKNTIKSGKILVQRLSGIGGDEVIIREDSLTSYALPLNVNSDISEFLLLIDSVEYGLSFKYERDTLFREGVIAIEAHNIKLIDYSGFDNAIFPCDTLNCKSYEATATLHF